MSAAGRNDPCPCGSGRKYKNCCLAREAAGANTSEVRALNDVAMAHQRAGRLDEAAAVYRRAIALAPGNADLHFNLGTALQARGNVIDAVAAYRSALAIDDKLAVAHHNLANALRARGDFDAALLHYRRAVALAPGAVHPRVDLASLLQMLGDSQGAVTAYELALRIEPRNAALYDALAGALEDAGRRDDAFAAYRRALAHDDAAPIRANFARCVARATHLPDDPALRALLARAIRETWSRPNDLARIASVVLAQRPFDDEATRPLLLALLEDARICDIALERSLEQARVALLAEADRAAPPEPTRLQCALAHQCEVNEHVFSTGEDELAKAQALRTRLVEALHAGRSIPAAWLVAVAAYYPLADVPGIESLLDHAWSESVAALLTRCVRNPLAERRARASIPALTDIEDPVSRSVRAQYEVNPYPRWTRLPRPLRTSSLSGYLRALFPFAQIAGSPPPAPEVLIAGCGTGQEAIDLASIIPAARFTAIDLSRASVAYAQRKAREAGLRNLECAQADLLELPATGRTFDVIGSMGVLHHLSDPAAGLRALAGMLRARGFMRLGFYSERGRSDVVAARAFIAAAGYEGTAAGIRRCRDALIERAGPFERLFARLSFYSTSECRDLLFHVQEHRLTLPQIHSMLEANGLRLLGFLLDPATLAHYTRRFPDDPSRTSFAHWHTLEAEQPALFAGMYRFWVQRAP